MFEEHSQQTTTNGQTPQSQLLKEIQDQVRNLSNAVTDVRRKQHSIEEGESGRRRAGAGDSHIQRPGGEAEAAAATEEFGRSKESNVKIAEPVGDRNEVLFYFLLLRRLPQVHSVPRGVPKKEEQGETPRKYVREIYDTLRLG